MNDHIVVNVFLRGAMDGLSYLAPHGDSDYQQARPDLAIPTSAALPLDETFGLHPAASGLWDIWQTGEVAFIPASGSVDESRSHFDAMAIMEAGLGPGDLGISGWLGRYVAGSTSGDQLEAVAVGQMIPRSLLGFPTTIGLADLATFRLGSIRGQGVAADVGEAVRTQYQPGETELIAAQGVAAFGVLDTLETAGLTGSEMPEEFGDSTIGADLWQAAQLIEADLGVRVITVDFGGWDHHNALGTFESGPMHDHVESLSVALAGFWQRITEHHDRVSVVVMSEFGRRVQQNTSGGTDHGHGGVMTILGGGINGGIHGEWSGLGSDVLDRGDVPVLTDYRTVLAEVIDQRVGAAELLSDIFPGFAAEANDYVGVA